MLSMFPLALRFSRIPNARMSAKTVFLRSSEDIWKCGREGWRGVVEGIEEVGERMKNQSGQQIRTAIRFMVIVVRSVRRRSGVWSTHLPTVDEKAIEASVRIMPLMIC